jgi:hypothetical protein
MKVSPFFRRKAPCCLTAAGVGTLKMLKASFLAVFLLDIYAVFTFESIGHEETALTAASPLATGPSTSGTEDTFEVNSVAKADRLPRIGTAAETTTAAIEPAKLAPAPAERKGEATKTPVTSWHWHAGSNKITRK